MTKKKLEILEIYSGEIIDMNNVQIKKEKTQKNKKIFFCEMIKNCFVSAFPKAE
ncbi:MAG: hypothetical protein HFE58_03075 [Firmicutes bacterium]|jgi:hypothetical protein|nr:hypothetical protein [Bacillota bacterium]